MRAIDADALETVITQLNENGWGITRNDYKLIDRVLSKMPTIELTLNSYPVKHLELIAMLLQKENLPPERVREILTDVSRIVKIVFDEFEKTLSKALRKEIT